MVLMLAVLLLQSLAPYNEITDIFSADPNAADLAHHSTDHHPDNPQASDHQHGFVHSEHNDNEPCENSGHAECHAHQHVTPTTLPQRWSIPKLSSVIIKQPRPFLRAPLSPVTGIYRPPIA